MAVTDASLITSLLSEPDVNHAAARRWFDPAHARGEPLFAPTIILAEVASAFGRTLGDPARVRIAVQRIVDWNLMTLVAVATSLARRSAEVTADTRLKGCDSIYVALAAELDEVLVTFDQEQLSRITGMIRVTRPS